VAGIYIYSHAFSPPPKLSRKPEGGGRRIQQQVGLVERVGGGRGVVGTTNTASSYTYTILAYSFSLILLTSQRAIWVCVVTFSREQQISGRINFSGAKGKKCRRFADVRRMREPIIRPIT
jgi:hypothetical protein